MDVIFGLMLTLAKKHCPSQEVCMADPNPPCSNYPNLSFMSPPLSPFYKPPHLLFFSLTPPTPS